jgi:hypothetical protein
MKKEKNVFTSMGALVRTRDNCARLAKRYHMKIYELLDVWTEEHMDGLREGKKKPSVFDEKDKKILKELDKL